MADPTNAELAARIDQLNQRMAQLPAKSQVDNLLASVEDYKSTQAAQITELQNKIATLESKVSDLESRVQALESA